MTLQEFTKERILEDVAKLQYLCGLKRVIRYNQTRPETDITESVAEHVYGMQVLALYFLPLENPEGTWDKSVILETIALHDLDEVETGDVIGWTKTPEQRALELSAMEQVILKAPLHMQTYMKRCLQDYESRNTPEARFVRAIDKLEPQIHLFNQDNKILLKLNQTTPERNLSIKQPYMTDFPFIWKCCETIHQELLASGHYWSEGE